MKEHNPVANLDQLSAITRFLNPLAMPAVGPITATKVDSFTDDDGDGKAELGQQIDYTVMITNTGTNDATAMVFNDNIDAFTTLIGTSVNVSPLARDNSYTAVANTVLEVGVAASGNPAVTVVGSVFDNDSEFLSDTFTLKSVQAVNFAGGNTTATTAQGGTVTMEPDGNFSYLPAVGSTTTDSFTYTLTDNGPDNILGNADDLTGTGTVTITFPVATKVWYINNSLGVNGDGRSSSPFNTLAPVNAAGGGGDSDAVGDIIYVFTGSGNYTTGIALENNQQLIGNGVALSVNSNTLRPAGSAPTIANGATHALTLASDNVVTGLNLSASANAAIGATGAGGTTNITGIGITNTSSGAGLNLTNQTGTLNLINSPISGTSSGAAVLITGGAATINFSNSPVSRATGRLIDISGKTGGTVTFNNGSTVSSSGNITTDAISLLNNTGGTTITFSNNVMLTTNGTSADGIVTDNSTGSFTLNMNASGNTVSATGGSAIDLQDIAANITFTSTSSTNSTTNGLRVNNTTGSMSFGPTSVGNSTSTGVLLTSNASTLAFGDLDISPASGQRGLHATNNTATITTASGDIVTTTGISVEIVGTSSGSRTPLNMTLNKVSANGASNGIILANTNGPGASVGFIVNGDGTNTSVGGNNSGGIIQNTAGGDDDSPADAGGIGVRLVDVDEVMLRRMTLTTQANFGIYGERVTNFIFEYSKLNGTNGTLAGIGGTFNSDATVVFNELTGAALFKDAIIEGGLEDNVRVINTTGTLNRIVFNNVTVGLMDLGNDKGDNGVLLQVRNSATMNVTIQDSDFTHARGDIFQFDLTDTATGDLIFDNNTVNNQHPFVVTGGGGITISGGGSATAAPNLTYEFDNNTFRGARGDAILILWQTGSGSSNGRIEGNTFGVNSVDKSCSSEGQCIEIRTEGRGAHTTLINNNIIRQYAAFGIYLEMDGINTAGSTGTIGALNATITNNLIEQPNTAPVTNKNGIHLNHGATSGDNYSSCVDIRTNTTGNAGNEASVGQDIILRRRMLTSVRLPGYAGATNDVTAVEAFIANQNNGVESVNALTDATAGGYVGGAACTQPVASLKNLLNEPNGIDMKTASTEISPKTKLPTAPVSAVELSASTQYSQARTRAVAERMTGTRQVTHSSSPIAAFGQPLKLAALRPVSEPAFKKKTQQATATNVTSRSDFLSHGASKLSDTNASRMSTARVAALVPVSSGENVSVAIGTLPGGTPTGKSITIKFSVTVDDPFNSSNQYVANQANITGTNFAQVDTDDPNPPAGFPTAGANSTVTPVDAIQITISDVSIAEGAVGDRQMVFTLTLSNPAPAAGVSVDYSTANNTAVSGPTPAGDYAASTGTATVTSGNLTGTFSVPVHGDTVFEGNETFFVNLSNAVNGTLLDTQAVGTIADDESQPADFDGDGIADPSVWGADLYWRANLSSTGLAMTPYNWGSPAAPFNDVAVPGDYDGDNKTDFAVWRPSEGNWYIVRSSDGVQVTKGWGAASLGDVPVPGDYDGDGKTDIAVWRAPEGNWYVIKSSNDTVQLTNWGGFTGDIPVPADYDGDGKTDAAVFRPSEGNWYILRSSDGSIVNKPWGVSTDTLVPGDYDGDGKADVAVWRASEGNWYIVRSSDNVTTVKGWGGSVFNDVPVPADYDGDGRTDIAVWRPAEGNWYILKSSDNTDMLRSLGVEADKAIPSLYPPQ